MSEVVYHYTKSCTLDKIRKNKEIFFSSVRNFWLGNGSDKKEFIHGLNILKLFLLSYKNLDLASYQLDIDDLVDFIQKEQQLNEAGWFTLSCSLNEKNKHLYKTYSCSNADVLSLESTCFAVLPGSTDLRHGNIFYIDTPNDNVLKQAKFNKEIESLISELNKIDQSNQDCDNRWCALGQILKLALRIKHTDYKDEQEYRFFIFERYCYARLTEDNKIYLPVGLKEGKFDFITFKN